MSTLAQITAAIDDDIRNKTPLVLKVEHADVEQLITDEMFPDSLLLSFNATSQTSGAPFIVVNPLFLSNWDAEANIYFEKIGNRVFYSGFISSGETAKALGTSFGLSIASFASSLYQPIGGSNSRYSSSTLRKVFVNPTVLPNACITMFDDGIVLFGLIPQGQIDLYIEGSYKVAN
jgi:hypothetical protein